MRRIIIILLACFSAHVAAQKLYLYPATVVAPRGSYQTLTAVVTGVNNKTVTWTTTGGTLVGTNPCIVNEPCTIALYTTTPGTYTVTATSNVASSVIATSTITITGSPTLVIDHPRFLITNATLAELRAKATSNNVMYGAIRSQAVSSYNADKSVWSWSCDGGTGRPSAPQTYKEYDAYYFGLMSLLDPSDRTYKWGCYGRDVWVYEMTNVTNGSIFLGANEWSDASYTFPLASDYLMGSGALSSSSDLATARNFGAFLSKLVLAYVAAQNPAGAYNSPAMFSQDGQWDLGAMRSHSGNNYALSAMLIVGGEGMLLNDNATDDPPLTNTCSATRYQVCPDFTAGSLHAYAKYFFGAQLYDYWAHIEDPNVSWQAYQSTYANLPKQPACKGTDLAMHPCFGDGRGGESSEGSWYQYSMYRARYILNMMYTSGNADPLVNGPQVSASTSSWWDLKYVSDLEFLTGNNVAGTKTYPGYNYLTTGDSNTYVRGIGDAWTEAAMLTFDSYTGRTDRTNALKWINFNYAAGGPLGTSWGCTGSWCGYDASLPNINITMSSSTDMFIALPARDPLASLPPDPRPSLPLDLYNGSFNQHQVLRNSWTSPTLFSYYCNNTYANHEYQQCGTFTIFANGEYISKAQTQFDNYNKAMTNAASSNLVSIVNSTGTTCRYAPTYCAEWTEFTRGGQMSQGFQTGQMTLYHSELPTYAADIVNSTGSYNGTYWAGYNDVVSASRSLVYLRGSNQVVFYDRSAVRHSTSTQALYQITTGAPAVSGNVASWLTRSSHQKAYFTSLLPSGGTLNPVKLVDYVTTSAPYSNLQIGTSETVTCTITYKDGTAGACSSAPVDDWTAYGGWTSNNKAVATVNAATGLITTVGPGAAAITAIVNGIQAYGQVTVVSGSSGGSWNNVSDMDQTVDWEPASSLEVRPPGSPTSTRFLSILEWGGSALSKSATTLVQSTAGQNFDCAEISTSMVCFMRNWPAAFTEVTYPASGATTHYISDLSPNTAYTVLGDGAPSSVTSDAAGVLTFSGAGTGSITIRTAVTIGTSTGFRVPALCAAAAIATTIVLSSCARRLRS